MRQVVAAVSVVTLLIGSELAHAQAVDLTWITAPTPNEITSEKFE